MSGGGFGHYFKPCPYESIDVYRVLLMFGVTDPALQHAIKKLLVAGGRGGGKDVSVDVTEAIAALQRWRAMREEERRQEPMIDVESTLGYRDVLQQTPRVVDEPIAQGEARIEIHTGAPPMQQQPAEQRPQFIDEGTREVRRAPLGMPIGWRP